MVICGVILFCIAASLCSDLFDSSGRARLTHFGLNIPAAFAIGLALFVFALFAAIRPFYMNVTITDSQIEIPYTFGSHIVPFADISGRRDAAGRGVRGMYLYRRNKSRVFVRESLFRQDDFYKRWRASIYDLDKADRLKRKTKGRETPLDWFATDNIEQHATIGGPQANSQ
jgi:hypothetical protein